MSSFDALTELRRSAGTQLDPEYVEILASLLAGRDFSYRHGEDADFDAELALDARIDEHASAGTTRAPRIAAKA
ncbi:MAG: hypothetical protein E6G49_00165 [Actinobacteria bacterium]|nr:MAG: hypothetical protein E6G49_00165 [Actinomycetota bacterium]